VQATDGAALGGVGVVDLGNGLAPADSGKLFCAKQPGEEASAITKGLSFYKLQAGQREVRNSKTVHGNAS
jgi:hypothetical protein